MWSKLKVCWHFSLRKNFLYFGLVCRNLFFRDPLIITLLYWFSLKAPWSTLNWKRWLSCWLKMMGLLGSMSCQACLPLHLLSKPQDHWIISHPGRTATSSILSWWRLQKWRRTDFSCKCLFSCMQSVARMWWQFSPFLCLLDGLKCRLSYSRLVLAMAC